MFWFSYLLVPDAKPSEVILALVIEGLGQGILFWPLLQYMLGSVHANYSMNTMQAAVATRYWTSTIGFSLMQNVVLYLTTQHQFYMTENLDVTKTQFQDQWSSIFNQHYNTRLVKDSISLTTQQLKNQLFEQALLVSDMQIFRTLSAVGLITMVLIFFFQPVRRRLGL